MSIALTLFDPHLNDLRAYVLNHTGLWYYADRDEDFASRVDRRLHARGVRNCAEYLRLLRSRPAGEQEMEDLVGELTIGETYFFRQMEHFDILREHLIPELLQRNEATRRIRIWSAGCATGAEPYSVAMVLELYFADQLRGWDATIIGTDINIEFLQRAREASFAPWAFRATPEWIKSRCFEQEGRWWVLRPEFRRRVSFQRHNLATNEPVPGPPFDLILCRNVMIYFAPDLNRQTAGSFYDALTPGGWLLVGHAEPNIEVFERFDRIAMGNVTLYQRPFDEAEPLDTMKSPVAWDAYVPVPQGGSETALPVHGPARQTARSTLVPPLPAAPEPVRTAASPSVDEVRILADRGEWEAALSLCRRITELDPLNANAHFTMGLILEHSSSCSDAAHALRRAIYLDRAFALAHYHLGRCLQSSRQYPDARKAFRSVLTLVSERPPEDVIEGGDGMTAAELRELTHMHLELLSNA